VAKATDRIMALWVSELSAEASEHVVAWGFRVLLLETSAAAREVQFLSSPL
jgi:hypothetical protein